MKLARNRVLLLLGICCHICLIVGAAAVVYKYRHKVKSVVERKVLHRIARVKAERIAATNAAWNNLAQPARLDTSPVAWGKMKSVDNPARPDRKFRGIDVVDRDYLLVRFVDGEVVFNEDADSDRAYTSEVAPEDNTVVRYGKPLNMAAALSPIKWRITSLDDPVYGEKGLSPRACHRKSKLNGMAQEEWLINDFGYEYTLSHWLYLALPSPLVQGKTYTVQIAPETNTDVTQWRFTYDRFNSRSEAIHVNLAGYPSHAAIHAADLYMWLGNGGGRDYSAFEGNQVFLYNTKTRKSVVVGEVAFWKPGAEEAHSRNFTRSDVWTVDFSGEVPPGEYRLVVDGVGASQDFIIGAESLFEPLRVSTLGFFYMRIGEDGMKMTPVPRRPLWIPGKAPEDCRVVVTDMDPYHPDWPNGGDRWDQPAFFARYVKSGAPQNPNAVGGHSDALDWDRHLGHVSIIYDLLLPYILTHGKGANGSDAFGIPESNNGIPDILDEARYEVDFWLNLRYRGGYSHGLSNPDHQTHILYQADNTAIAAWANAANAAMMAEAFRIANAPSLMKKYLSEAERAYQYASGLRDQMLDDQQNVGESVLTGRDFRMTAAAWLYNLTGESRYEKVIASDSIVTSDTSDFLTGARNQLYAMAAYLTTQRQVHYPELLDNMRASVTHQAMVKGVRNSETWPSRRSTDATAGWFQTIQFVHRIILAHAVTRDVEERARFEKALRLEADWGLGRNPLNMIQMTTATTGLGSKRSVENCYTSGFNDGTPGVHPGHTPYLNMKDWSWQMVMGRASWLGEKVYPPVSEWPAGELYFNTRYVYSHSEFTPQQTMRGKQALYGYLAGIDSNP